MAYGYCYDENGKFTEMIPIDEKPIYEKQTFYREEQEEVVTEEKLCELHQSIEDGTYVPVEIPQPEVEGEDDEYPPIYEEPIDKHDCPDCVMHSVEYETIKVPYEEDVIVGYEPDIPPNCTLEVCPGLAYKPVFKDGKWVKTYEPEIPEVPEVIDPPQTDLSKLLSRVEDLEDLVVTLQKENASLKENQVDISKVESLESKTTSLADNLLDLKDHLIDPSRLVLIENEVSRMSSIQLDMREKLIDPTRVGFLEESLGSLQKDYFDTKKTIVNAERVEEIESKVIEVESSLAETDKIARDDTKVTAVAQRCEAISTTLAKVQLDQVDPLHINELERNVSSVGERLEGLSSRVDSIEKNQDASRPQEDSVQKEPMNPEDLPNYTPSEEPPEPKQDLLALYLDPSVGKE